MVAEIKWTVLKVREQELKELNAMKIHPNQPYWEIIKMLLDEHIEKTK